MRRRLALILFALLAVVASTSCSGGADGAPPGPPASGGLKTLHVPGFGTKTVDPGYLPDPYMIEMAAGGDVDVASLGLGNECTGYTSIGPAFRLVLAEDFDHLSLFFVPADGSSDTSLILNGADGEWICNDDSPLGGIDPFIEFEGTASGDYEVWVGIASATGTITGTFHFTELDYHPGYRPWSH